MLGRHEIPTKLEVEDKVVFGMTARQLLFVGMGVALGFVIYQRLSHLGPHQTAHLSFALVPSIVLGLIPVGIALAAAFIRPADRTLETWAMALVHYSALPKRCVWRPFPNEQGDDGHMDQRLLTELHPPDDESDEPESSDEPMRLGNQLSYQEVVQGH